ncbi:MAG: holo-ACP synthase [Myxococcales bacterium]|nr:holo-ACP synthase [Myxococcales bacterium]MCB9581707.1 holo-ACP synthase [Polyangiaceae bacterium]
MILGLGIDVASIERMERALARHGERMWERILTTEERRELEGRSADRAAALAGRFAAKEALSKALGAPRDVWFHDVEVRRGALGAPEIRLLGPAVKRAQERGVARCFVSITHDAGVAAAVVVLEGDAG